MRAGTPSQSDIDLDTPERVPVLEVRRMRKVFSSAGLLTRRKDVVAVDDVSFRMNRGEAVALVGESGSGKSTIGRLLLRLERPNSGQILLSGDDVLKIEPRRASLAFRGRVQMVFQDPFGSLNPVHTVAHHLIRPLIRHSRSSGNQATQILELLRTVGLEPAEEFFDRHPYELSGGQRQRVAIARALAAEPDVLVADEPTSMLDVSIRMGILNLLDRLKREKGLAILLITHDLAAARHLADRVLVLFQGQIVEDGPAESIVESPRHPYTQLLLESIANVDTEIGGVPAPVIESHHSPGTGCPFASRCGGVMDACYASNPAPRLVDGHIVRCHLYPEGSPTS